MDPAKLKVVELRSELAKLGLDTKGNKAVLVERLRKALDEPSTAPEGEPMPTEAQNENLDLPISQSEREKTPEPAKVMSPAKTPGRSPRSAGGTPTKTTPSRGSPKNTMVKSPIVAKPSSPIPEPPSEAPKIEESPVEEPEKEDETAQDTPMPENLVLEPESEPPEAETTTPLVAEDAPEVKSSPDKISTAPEPIAEEPAVPDTRESSEPEDDTPAIDETPVNLESKMPKDAPENMEKAEECPVEDKENIDEPMKEDDSEEKMIINEEEESLLLKDDVEPEDENNEVKELKEATGETEEADEADEKEEKSEPNELNREREPDQDNNEQDVEMKTVTKPDDDRESKDDRRDRKERKRKRSTSSQDDRHKSPPPSRNDDEPEIDYSRVLLSWYDSDLNLVIDKSKFLSATPMHNDGFGYVWAGARASFGYTSGKVFYEVKITHQCNVSLQDEEHPHILRAGWSAAQTGMQLGEEKFSYGYDGTRHISSGNNFLDYGSNFGLNDILGCYLDMSGDDVIMSYTLNGESLGEAFKIPKLEVDGKALFPHVLTKNCAFVCNFGDEAPWNDNVLEGYVPVGQVDIEDRTAGPHRPDKREDCEVLVMCGLPGAGKSHWATTYAAEHPEKLYNVLGTNNLIDKMKVTGLPRKQNYHGQWGVLIDKCTRCLNKLLEVAATRRRNYILDMLQTNVYDSAQRRKMRHFYGFQRKAIVIVPTEEEFKSRTAKREAIEGKDVPESEVMEMKANFTAPVIGESFDAIEWVELDEEEAKKLIAKYNKEGKDAGFGHQATNKRPRFEKSDSHRDSRDIRSSRDSRDSRDYRDRRSGYSDRNRNSTWRGSNQMSGGGGGGGGGGGWRDRMPRGPPHMRHSSSNSSGYGSPSSGWRGGRGGPSSIAPHRGSDRRVSSTDRRSGMDRSRSGAARQGGGWGPMNSSSYHNSSHSSGGWGGNQQSSGWSSGQSQQQGSWGNSPSNNWSGQQQNWGSWKSYGQSNYNQNNYSQQQGYGNGNWGSWNQQYYNQYWGNQPSSQSGQSTTTSGQSAIASGGTAAVPSTTSTGSTYNNYSPGWQGYTQSYYSTDSSNSSTQQQK